MDTFLRITHKRNSKKNDVNTTHVDHILSIKGIDEKFNKLKNVPSPVTEHVVNGIIHSTMEGLKSNMKMNLPVITDIQEDEDADTSDKETELTSQPIKKEFSYLYDSREIIDLSPIYENSSEACSSHDDLTDTNYNKERDYNSNNNEYSTTPISMSLSEPSIDKNIINNKADSKIIEIAMLQNNPEDLKLSECNLSFVTVTGNIKGENIGVTLGKSKELATIDKGLSQDYKKDGKCSMTNGPHIFLFTLLCLPFVVVFSFICILYLGTHMLYNILIHFSKKRTTCKKLAIPLMVIILYPFFIVFTFVFSLNASVVQITCSLRKWQKVFNNFDKGFCGWLCGKLNVPECCPYTFTEMES